MTEERLSFNLAEIEKIALELCLEHVAGDEDDAAELLGVSRGVFTTKCKKHGIKVTDRRRKL
jgi:DNA-binding protein Fis